MKKILGLILFIVYSLIGISQTIIPTRALRGEILSFTSVSANVYLVEFNVQDYSGKTNGSFIEEDSTWVVWQNCKRYIITNIDCASCFLFSNNIKVEITDVSADGVPGFGFVTINEEDINGISGFVSQVDDDLYQCISLYYSGKITNAIGISSGGISYYTDDNFSTIIPAIPAPVNGSLGFDRRKGGTFMYNGTNWATQITLEDGQKAFIVHGVTGDTLDGWNLSTHNSAHLGVGIGDIFISNPLNINGQFAGEIFLVRLEELDLSDHAITWDTLFINVDGSQFTSDSLRSGEYKVYPFIINVINGNARLVSIIDNTVAKKRVFTGSYTDIDVSSSITVPLWKLYDHITYVVKTTSGATSHSQVHLPAASATYDGKIITLISIDSSGTWNTQFSAAGVEIKKDGVYQSNPYNVADGKTVTLTCVKNVDGVYFWNLVENSSTVVDGVVTSAAFDGTTLTLTRSIGGDVTVGILNGVYKDDAAAAAGGVLIGELYELSIDNSYGFSAGILKTRRN